MATFADIPNRYPAVTINDEALIKELDGFARFFKSDNLQAMKKPLTDWRDYMLVRTDLLFATGSRDNVKWPRLKASTKEGRKKKALGHVRPLEVTGELRHSIKGNLVFQVNSIDVLLGTNDPKAQIHHGGAHVPAKTIKPKKAKVLHFTVGGKDVFATKVDIPAFDIPARPIVFISEKDHATAVRYVREQQFKLMRTAFPKAKVQAA